MNTPKLILISFLFLTSLIAKPLLAQKYITKTGHAYFLSHTDAIDIDANNNLVGAIIDIKTGDIFVKVLIKAFEFSLATADKHFNETYMESHEYPNATYKGKIAKLPEINVLENGEYDVETQGKLTIHGVCKDVKETGKLLVKEGTVSIECNFVVKIEDFKIEVPKLVKERVAKEVSVKINLNLESKN